MLRSFVSDDWMIFIFRCQGKISEKKACVANTTRRWDAMNPFRNLGERYGQYEEFTGRIRNLLKDYPDGLSIPKELIQNSDDAKVRLKSVVVFIFSLEFMWERKKKRNLLLAFIFFLAFFILPAEFRGARIVFRISQSPLTYQFHRGISCFKLFNRRFMKWLFILYYASILWKFPHKIGINCCLLGLVLKT